MTPRSRLTPDLSFLCTVAGHHVYSDGRTFSVDERLDEATQGRVVEYMINEGFIEGDDWVFLT